MRERAVSSNSSLCMCFDLFCFVLFCFVLFDSMVSLVDLLSEFLEKNVTKCLILRRV